MKKPWNPLTTRRLLAPAYTYVAQTMQCTVLTRYLLSCISKMFCPRTTFKSANHAKKTGKKERFEENSPVKSPSNAFYCALTIKLQHVFRATFLQLFSHLLACLKNITGKRCYQGRFNLEHSGHFVSFRPQFPPFLPFLYPLSPFLPEGLTHPLTHIIYFDRHYEKRKLHANVLDEQLQKSPIKP